MHPVQRCDRINKTNKGENEKALEYLDEAENEYEKVLQSIHDGTKPQESKSEDYEKEVTRDDIDVVSICVISFLHCETALKAIKAGKHVLVEKFPQKKKENASPVLIPEGAKVGEEERYGLVKFVCSASDCEQALVRLNPDQVVRRVPPRLGNILGLMPKK